MPIQAVLFDFGGVLVRTEDWSGRQRWAERLGLAPDALYQLVFDSDPAVRATLGQAPASAVWAHVAQTLRLSPAELDECQRDFWAGDVLDLDLVALLRQLRPRYQTAILSNAWSNAREAFTRQFGLDQVVDEMIISSEVGQAKPAPEIYHYAAARLDRQPDECLFVDDMPRNVEAARAAGLSGLVYTAGLDLRAELEKHGVRGDW
jgi:putative hydrolase of the HAD superfamily